MDRPITLGHGEKKYLGDGAYVDFDGYAIILTAENGLFETDRVMLEPEVYKALATYVGNLNRKHADAKKEEESTDA